MNIPDTLLADGWREQADHLRPSARSFYKRFDTPTNCHPEKHGVAIGIRVYKHGGADSFELELYGELQDRSAIQFLHYGLDGDLAKGLAGIPRLLSTWEHIANYKRP